MSCSNLSRNPPHSSHYGSLPPFCPRSLDPVLPRPGYGTSRAKLSARMVRCHTEAAPRGYRHDELGASDCRSNLGLGFGHTKVGQASHHKPAKGDASLSFEMRAGVSCSAGRGPGPPFEGMVERPGLGIS
jgi:hypothetical protein